MFYIYVLQTDDDWFELESLPPDQTGKQQSSGREIGVIRAALFVMWRCHGAGIMFVLNRDGSELIKILEGGKHRISEIIRLLST